MGTGGTLPTNITQSVTLYNTTGVIEKDKGIYFCPFIRANIAVPVFQRWLILFNNVVKTHNNYKNIPISQWSPKDRSLTIKASVDDFRLITEEGNCFNYLIVTRNVTTNSKTVPYFYAFFITDVQQVGNGSVRLELESDDFTNVFFLHNKNRCNQYSGYYVDVFNERMKNCYVARQHYNRVKISTRPLSYQNNNVSYEGNPTVININLYSEISELSNYKDKLDITSISLHDVTNNVDITDLITTQELTSTENGYVLHLELSRYFQDEQLSINLQLQSYYAEEDNLPIFSQIEEGFKYKRQYRDYKEFINYGDPLTEEEKQAYEGAVLWNDLSSELKIKALKLSTAFVHIVLKSSKIVIRHKDSGKYKYPKLGNYVPNTPVLDSLLTLVLPIYQKLPLFAKFEQDIAFIFNNIICKIKSLQNTYTISGINLAKANDLYNFLGELGVQSEYVITAYLTKESSLMSALDYTDSNITLNFRYTNESHTSQHNRDLYPDMAIMADIDGYEEGIQTAYLNAITNNQIYWERSLNNNTYTYSVTFSVLQDVPIENMRGVIFAIEDNKKISFELDLSESRKQISTIKTTYIDSVLSFNPYSFYSVSYLGRIEVPLNKVNYYEKPKFNCDLTIVVADVNKLSFIPTYTIEGKEQKMYSESIEQTLTNQLTIINTRLADFLIANQTQMKNQYAVNDLNHEHGLVSTFVSGVGNIGGGIGKGAILESAISGLAGVGALTGAVQTATGLIGEGLDWSRDTKQIAMNQKAKLADIGNLPSNLKQAGSDINIDMSLNELGLYLNHYTIDKLSYNSICKYLERFGYMVNIYDSLNVNTRKGWDFVQLKSFDYEAEITNEQEENIRQIFANGVTLLHDKSFMVSGHNYEIILD